MRLAGPGAGAQSGQGAPGGAGGRFWVQELVPRGDPPSPAGALGGSGARGGPLSLALLSHPP